MSSLRFAISKPPNDALDSGAGHAPGGLLTGLRQDCSDSSHSHKCQCPRHNALPTSEKKIVCSDSTAQQCWRSKHADLQRCFKKVCVCLAECHSRQHARISALKMLLRAITQTIFQKSAAAPLSKYMCRQHDVGLQQTICCVEETPGCSRCWAESPKSQVPRWLRNEECQQLIGCDRSSWDQNLCWLSLC